MKSGMDLVGLWVEWVEFCAIEGVKGGLRVAKSW